MLEAEAKLGALYSAFTTYSTACGRLRYKPYNYTYKPLHPTTLPLMPQPQPSILPHEAAAAAARRSVIMALIKNSPALYEERTRGALAT